MNTLPLPQFLSVLKSFTADTSTMEGGLTSYATALNGALGSRCVFIQFYPFEDEQTQTLRPEPPVEASSVGQDTGAIKALLTDLAPETTRLTLEPPSSSWSRARPGPLQMQGTALNADEAVLMHCEQLPKGYAYIVIIGPHTLATPAARSSISEVLNITLQFFTDYSASKPQPRLREFYSTILSAPSTTPHENHVLLCNSWKLLLEATAAWLWIFNKHTDRWELSAVSTGAEPQADVPLYATPHRNCLAEYCTTSERCEFASDIQTWERELGDTVYTIACKDHFKSITYRAVECIPLLLPEIPTDSRPYYSTRLPLKAAMCIYYETPPTRPSYNSRSLMLAGRLSASKLLESYDHEQYGLLEALTRLSHHFLTTKVKRPAELRKAYLKSVINLCQKRGVFKFASIFYQDATRQNIYCLASTGLWTRGGRKLTDEEIEEVTYPKGKGRTGGVFEDGEPFVPHLGQSSPQDSTPTFKEIDPTKPEEHTTAWTIYPIFSAFENPSHTKSECIGVLRCTGNTSPIKHHTRDRNFDPVQLQTIGFIASQLALPLEILSAQISREKSVSLVKHDLFSPIKMVSNSVVAIEDWLTSLSAWLKDVQTHVHDQAVLNSRPQLGAYAIMNLSAAAIQINELVHRLDPDPTAIEKLNRAPTRLEGDVLARLKAMLLDFAKGENDMTIHFESFSEIPPLMVDKVLIERVFTNLIVNAIKYGQPGTEIIVEPRKSPAGYHVTVSNRGIGIGPEETELIFKREYRGQWARKHQIGSGLGLKISRSIMEMHGGRLTLLSRVDPTVFELFFRFIR